MSLLGVWGDHEFLRRCRSEARGERVIKWSWLLVMSLFVVTAEALAAGSHPVRGIVVRVDTVHASVVISCDAIPGYMGAMEMSFAVRDARAMARLAVGETVEFTMVDGGKVLYADGLREGSAENFESEPMEAAGMTALQGTLGPSTDAKVIAPGESVPDFILTDQAGKEVHLADLRGKVVVLTFGYSRCPNPAYCFRLSDNLAKVERRFAKEAGRDFVLVTIAIDPEHDRGDVLRAYAAVWHADPEKWHFLSGPLPEIRHVAGMFGMNFWRRDGLLTHSLHTVILDREGRLITNLEGNQFTAEQLGDLVQTAVAERN